jgi:hypothetical protein
LAVFLVDRHFVMPGVALLGVDFRNRFLQKDTDKTS